jgi:hypothetical protein
MLSHFCINVTFTSHKGASIAQSVWRLATGWTTKGSEFESLQGQEYYLLQVVRTGSGTHPASCRMGTGGSFPGGEEAGALT